MPRSILSADAEDADILFEDELRCLSEERKERVLHDASVTDPPCSRLRSLIRRLF